MIYRLLFVGLLVFLSISSCNHSKMVVLEPGFTIYLNDTSSSAIMNSLDILQRDIKNVLGEKARIVTDPIDPVKVKNALIIINEDAKNEFASENIEGFERHRIYISNGNILLHGSDMRGTIFAILTFSEKFLGIEPLWFWALHSPQKKEVITISFPFNYDSGEPYVKYRAWFPNDTDLFTPWRKESQLNKEVWLETMLRLKLNTVECGSVSNYSKPYAISEYAKLIDKYGMKITFHHISALNSPYNKWNDYWKNQRGIAPPELALSQAEQLEEFWRYNVRTVIKNGIDPIWVVNFRGSRDIPFWESFKDAPKNMEERAMVINNMVRKQVKILKEESGSDSPTARMIFYNELSDLLAAGLLKPPTEKNLIWNFVAARRDHFPNDDIKSIDIPEPIKLGYYMNLQFTSTGSHLVQAEGPWKMEENYKFVDGKNDTPINFSVMNAGNLREHLMTLSANAAMLWNWNNYTSEQFLLDFCSSYYGELHAKSIATLYHDFFYAYWNQKKNDLDMFERQYIFHDLRYKQAISQLSERFFEPVDMNPLQDYSSEQMPNRTFRIVPEDNESENQIEAIIRGTESSIHKFREVGRKADSIYSLLDDEYRYFFNDNLRLPSLFMLYLNESLNSFCKAYISKPGKEQLQYLKISLSAALDARETIHMTAHNQFENWYAEERIFDLNEFVDRIDKTLKFSLHNESIKLSSYE